MFSVFAWQVVNEHRDLTKLQRQLERKTFSEQYKNSARTLRAVSANFFPFPAQLRRENGKSKEIKTRNAVPLFSSNPSFPTFKYLGDLVGIRAKKVFKIARSLFWRCLLSDRKVPDELLR